MQSEARKSPREKALPTAWPRWQTRDPRIVVLDGDVKNSTYTEEFEKVAPDRFFRRLHCGTEHRRNGHGAGGAGQGARLRPYFPAS